VSKPEASSTVSKLLGEDVEPTPSQEQSPEEAAFASIEQAIAAGKPITVSFGPQSLERVRDFLEKPHFRSNYMWLQHLLLQALIP